MPIDQQQWLTVLRVLDHLLDAIDAYVEAEIARRAATGKSDTPQAPPPEKQSLRDALGDLIELLLGGVLPRIIRF